MIDIIVNTAGGIVLAHDEPALDGCRGVRVGMLAGDVTLVLGDGTERNLVPLEPPVLRMVRKDMPARMIRMDGWSLARSSAIDFQMDAR